MKLIHGNCLEVMKKLEKESIDLVLTDPPYGIIENRGRTKSTENFNPTDWDVCLDMEEMFNNILRVTKLNKRVILFGAEPFTTKLRSKKPVALEFNQGAIWLKNSFSNYLNVNKTLMSCYEDINIFTKVVDTNLIHPMRKYSKKICEYTGLTAKGSIKHFGSGIVDHFLRWDSSQFEKPSERAYNRLVEEFDLQNMKGYITYEELYNTFKRFKAEYSEPVFNLHGHPHIKNVFEYPKPKQSERIHPTQKPVELLEELILTYSNEGDTVLDFTAGSFSTAIACINTNRNFIGIELNEEYYKKGVERVDRKRKGIIGMDVSSNKRINPQTNQNI